MPILKFTPYLKGDVVQTRCFSLDPEMLCFLTWNWGTKGLETVACKCVPAGKFDPEESTEGVIVIPADTCHLVIEDGVGECVGECKPKGNTCKPFLSTLSSGETAMACICKKEAITSLKPSLG
jgi:hypothetical protein